MPFPHDGAAASFLDDIAALKSVVLGLLAAGDEVTPVNAIGVVTTTATLKPGQNTLTLTSSDALVITFPANPQLNEFVAVTITNAASTAGSLGTPSPAPLTAGGTLAVTATASAVDYFEFKYTGSSWVCTNQVKNISAV